MSSFGDRCFHFLRFDRSVIRRANRSSSAESCTRLRSSLLEIEDEGTSISLAPKTERPISNFQQQRIFT